MKVMGVFAITGCAVGFAFGFVCIYAITSVAVTHLKGKRK